MKKVLVYGMTANPTGVESVIMNYYKHIDRSRVQFDFISCCETLAYEQEIRELGGEIYRVTPKRKKQFRKQLNEIFQNNSYDAVWVNDCFANLIYLKYAKKYGVKIRIIHSHNSHNMGNLGQGIKHKICKRFLTKYATNFWACGELAGKYFYSQKIRRSDKYKIINNAIDLNKYAFNKRVREQVRKELGVTENFVVGHVGRLHFQKNQEFLIDIFAEIKKREPSAVLLLVGQGEEKQKLVNKVKALNLDDSVKFLGLRADVERLLQAFDVMPFPSLFEGLSVVMIEGQASGVPIYASDTLAKDTKIADNFVFCSLKDPAKTWAEKIMSDRDNFKRKSNVDELRKAGYDINTEAEKFTQFIEKG